MDGTFGSVRLTSYAPLPSRTLDAVSIWPELQSGTGSVSCACYFFRQGSMGYYYQQRRSSAPQRRDSGEGLCLARLSPTLSGCTEDIVFRGRTCVGLREQGDQAPR